MADDQTTDSTDNIANDSTTDSTTDETTDTGGAGSKEAVLADLVSERKARQAAQTELDEVKARLEEFEEATKTEHEKALDKARNEAAKEARNEERARWERAIVRAEIKAAAAGRFADPEDAVLNVDLDSFDVDDDGQIDTDSLTQALDEVLQRKPHLNAERTIPTADQGARGGEDIPVDVSPGAARLRHAYAKNAKSK